MARHAEAHRRKGRGRNVPPLRHQPRDIKAAIGPGIGCCYQVGEELRAKFESQFAYADTLFHEVKDSDPVREKYPLLFLTARAPATANFRKKSSSTSSKPTAASCWPWECGNNIEASPLCTSCRTELLFSYRAEKGRPGD